MYRSVIYNRIASTWYQESKKRSSYGKMSSDSANGETAAQTASALSRSFLLINPRPPLALSPQGTEPI